MERHSNLFECDSITGNVFVHYPLGSDRLVGQLPVAGNQIKSNQYYSSKLLIYQQLLCAQFLIIIMIESKIIENDFYISQLSILTFDAFAYLHGANIAQYIERMANIVCRIWNGVSYQLCIDFIIVKKNHRPCKV